MLRRAAARRQQLEGEPRGLRRIRPQRQGGTDHRRQQRHRTGHGGCAGCLGRGRLHLGPQRGEEPRGRAAAWSSVPRSGVTGGEAVSAGGPTTDHAPHAGGRKRPPHHPSRRSDERGGGRRWSQRAWTCWSCSASRHRELTSISCARRWPCSPRRSWTARSRRRSAPATASAARCAPPGATATGRDAGTREWAASTGRSRSSARGATSRRYSSPGAAPSAPCWPSCNKRTWRGSPHAASTTSCARSAARASRRARSRVSARSSTRSSRASSAGPSTPAPTATSGSTRSPSAYARRAASPG